MLLLDCAKTVGVFGLPGTLAGIISRKLEGGLDPTMLIAIILNRYS